MTALTAAAAAAIKSNIYEVEFTGTMMACTNSLWTSGKLMEHSADGEFCKARVQLASNATANQLLSAVMPVANIQSFREIIPSMNDIFISTVNEENPLGTQSNFTE